LLLHCTRRWSRSMTPRCSSLVEKMSLQLPLELVQIRLLFHTVDRKIRNFADRLMFWKRSFAAPEASKSCVELEWYGPGKSVFCILIAAV